ncbi:MAG: DNA gyrase C-terminal beta-propeller domain-containing protein, partial [Bacilli bacterium]
VTNSGIIIRMAVEQISSTGRVAQGVKLINLKEEQKVSTIAVLPKDDITEQELVENDIVDSPESSGSKE